MFRSSALTIQFIPLVSTSSQPSSDEVLGLPQCSLLRLEHLTLLLDCGGTPEFENAEIIDAIKPYAQDIDAVLLSSSELSSCGSLPQLLPLLRPGAKVLATMATARLGILALTSQFLSIFGNADELMSRVEGLPPRPSPPENLSVKSIYAAFRSIKEVHFDQNVNVLSLAHSLQRDLNVATLATKPGKKGRRKNRRGKQQQQQQGQQEAEAVLDEIQHATIRAIAAGRVTGGSGFRIKYRDDDICYLPRFSPRDSFCVPGVNVRSALFGANILICDGSASCLADNPPLAAAANALKAVRDTLRKGGTALLPTNAFGVGVDLMQRLQQYFTEEGMSYQLVFASPKAREHVERLRLLSEFSMASAKWAKSEGPFSQYTLVTSPADLPGLQAAKCVVVHSIDMKDSLTCALLQDVMKDSRNLVLFTDPTSCTLQRVDANNAVGTATVSSAATVRHELLSMGNYKKSELRISCRIRTVLEGEQLEAFREEDKARRDAEEKAAQREAEKQRQLQAATELSLLNVNTSNEDNDNTNNNNENEDRVTASKNNNKDGKNVGGIQRQHQQQQQQQQHDPNMFISSKYEIKKRVKPDVLNFPGELTLSSSTRVLYDFGVSSNSSNENGKNGSSKNNDDDDASSRIWGLPLCDADLRRFRRFDAEANFYYQSSSIKNQNAANNNNDEQTSDAAAGGSFLAAATTKRSAQSQDETPAYVRDHELVLKKLLCKVDYIDISQWLDSTSLKIMLRSNCKSIRKIAFVNTNDADARMLINFCQAEDIAACTSSNSRNGIGNNNNNNNHVNIFCPRQNQEIEFATAVFSCEIKLHPALLAEIANSQRPVKTQSGSWQIAWSQGNLKNNNNNNNGNENLSNSIGNGPVRRQREGDDDEKNQDGNNNQQEIIKPVLCPVGVDNDVDENSDSSDKTARSFTHQVGSIFVGELRLPQIEKELRHKNHIQDVLIELEDDEAPLLVAGKAVAIRGVNFASSNSNGKNRNSNNGNDEDENENQTNNNNNNNSSSSSTTLAMEGVPCAAWFAARTAFRGSFRHIL